MKRSILAFALLALAGSGSAWADRGHGYYGGHGGYRGSFGVIINPWPLGYYPPAYYPYYPPAYYPPAYYPPVVTVQPAAPPVYVEQAPPPAETNYWYYCSGSNAYYPYVKDCPGGWQQVKPYPLPKQ